MDFSDSDLRTLRGFNRAIHLLRNGDKEMPLQQVMVLIYIGLREVASQRDMPEALGLPVSSISRNIGELSDAVIMGKQGLGLITWVVNPMDRRGKSLCLTPKGRTLIRRLLEALD